MNKILTFIINVIIIFCSMQILKPKDIFSKDKSNNYPETLVVKLIGAGSGIKVYQDSSGWWQQVKYELTVDFDLKAINPTTTVIF